MKVEMKIGDVIVPVIVYCYECDQNMEIACSKDDGDAGVLIGVKPCEHCQEEE